MEIQGAVNQLMVCKVCCVRSSGCSLLSAGPIPEAVADARGAGDWWNSPVRVPNVCHELHCSGRQSWRKENPWALHFADALQKLLGVVMSVYCQLFAMPGCHCQSVHDCKELCSKDNFPQSFVETTY